MSLLSQVIKPQPSALGHAQVEALVEDADWLLVFGTDEFLPINLSLGPRKREAGRHGGQRGDRHCHHVAHLRLERGRGLVADAGTERYTRAAPAHWNKGWDVKTLFRFDPEYWKLGIHRPSIENKHLEDGVPTRCTGSTTRTTRCRTISRSTAGGRSTARSGMTGRR